MIIDVHSHAWIDPDHMVEYKKQSSKASGDSGANLTVKREEYLAKATLATDGLKTIVFGLKAKLAGIWVPDEHVAQYVKQDPENLIGFMSLDPTQPGWQDEMRRAHKELGLRGIKLAPMYAGFRPSDSILDEMWEYATQHKLPVLMHTGTNPLSQSPVECTLPKHVDTVAIKFPDVKIIMAHLGHPFMEECVIVARKHENVYADISALHYRPWQLYNALMAVQEYGVWDKLLFGTDYPFTNVDDTIKGLRSLNNMLEGTQLPRLNEEEIEKMIHRDSLKILGLE